MRHYAIRALAMLAAMGLGACSSTQDVLDPAAIAVPAPSSGTTASTAADPAAPPLPSPSPQTPAQQPAATAPASATNPAPAQSAAIGSVARIQFAPIVGTSVEAATALSERLASRSRERGMVLARSNDPATTHMLKGYFTPLKEGKQTTVIYVWDVYDPSGNRIHRISGQEKAASGSGDGWKGVSDATMRTIAETTIDQLADWLAGRSG